MANQAIFNELNEIKSLLKKQKERPLNLVEAAKYLSISQSNLYRLTSQRKIPSHKPNGKYLYFFKEELDNWIKRSRSQESEDSSQNNDASTSLSTSKNEKGRKGEGVSTDDEEEEEPP